MVYTTVHSLTFRVR